MIDGSEGFVCSFFCIPKKGNGFRPIVNLKPLNKFIVYEHLENTNGKLGDGMIFGKGRGLVRQT